MTLNEIELLLYYHSSSQRHPRETAGAIIDSTEMLKGQGLIDAHSGASGYCTTAKGAAHILQLRNTPMPISKTQWFSADGKSLLPT